MLELFIKTLYENDTSGKNIIPLANESTILSFISLFLRLLTLLGLQAPIMDYIVLWRRHKQHNQTERRAVEYCMYI